MAYVLCEGEDIVVKGDRGPDSWLCSGHRVLLETVSRRPRVIPITRCACGQLAFLENQNE